MSDNGIDFFGNSEWPGSSPDLNTLENMGEILKEMVERQIIETGPSLEEALDDQLHLLEFDTELFCKILSSYPQRVRYANVMEFTQNIKLNMSNTYKKYHN